ncbi:hypothetical protein J6590_065044 [Homalodisca vitripennis]|nr:hypothetical protein J6590_065044 [Homalodisca vitripennis]
MGRLCARIKYVIRTDRPIDTRVITSAVVWARRARDVIAGKRKATVGLGGTDYGTLHRTEDIYREIVSQLSEILVVGFYDDYPNSMVGHAPAMFRVQILATEADYLVYG